MAGAGGARVYRRRRVRLRHWWRGWRGWCRCRCHHGGGWCDQREQAGPGTRHVRPRGRAAVRRRRVRGGRRACRGGSERGKGRATEGGDTPPCSPAPGRSGLEPRPQWNYRRVRLNIETHVPLSPVLCPPPTWRARWRRRLPGEQRNSDPGEENSDSAMILRPSEVTCRT